MIPSTQSVGYISASVADLLQDRISMKHSLWNLHQDNKDRYITDDILPFCSTESTTEKDQKSNSKTVMECN